MALHLVGFGQPLQGVNFGAGFLATGYLLCGYHFALSAQYAADIFPLAMFFACRALKLARFFFIVVDSPVLGAPAVFAPCSPKRMIFSFPLSHALTMCDFFGCPGVRRGVLHGMVAFLTGLFAIPSSPVKDIDGF
jgi:hypothetical protein